MRIWLALLPLLTAGACGCVSKAKARAQAQEAYFAGQREAMSLMKQKQSPSVSVVGPVKNQTVPWTQDLTVAKAVIEAEYFAPEDPRHIIVVRHGRAIPIDPKRLLNGDDMPLEPGDILHLSQ